MTIPPSRGRSFPCERDDATLPRRSLRRQRTRMHPYRGFGPDNMHNPYLVGPGNQWYARLTMDWKWLGTTGHRQGFKHSHSGVKKELSTSLKRVSAVECGIREYSKRPCTPTHTLLRRLRRQPHSSGKTHRHSKVSQGRLELRSSCGTRIRYGLIVRFAFPFRTVEIHDATPRSPWYN